jgi:hypothetical protein
MFSRHKLINGVYVSSEDPIDTYCEWQVPQLPVVNTLALNLADTNETLDLVHATQTDSPLELRKITRIKCCTSLSHAAKPVIAPNLSNLSLLPS